MNPVRSLVLFSGSGWHFGDRRMPNLTDAYLLSLVRPRPRILLVPTGLGDAEREISRYLRMWAGHDVDLDVATMFISAPRHRPVEQMFAEADIVYLVGGYTPVMVAGWQAVGWDRLLTAAADRGTVMAGISGGACALAAGWGSCWKDPMTGPGLGLVDFSVACHAGTRRATIALSAAVAAGEQPPGYLIGDSAILHFRDGRLVDALSSGGDPANAHATHIASDGTGGLVRTEVPLASLAGRAGEHADLGLHALADRLRTATEPQLMV